MSRRVESATSVGKNAFLASQLHQDAILRNLHTVTETTQRLSDGIKSEHPEVDWVKLAAFRNVLVHDYLGIDLELVWTVVTRDVPDSRFCHVVGTSQRRAKTAGSLNPKNS